MLTLVRQELYKLLHKTSTWVAITVMVVVQVIFAVLAWRLPSVFGGVTLFTDQFVGGEFIVFFAIAMTAGIIAMEFQYGTIKPLLYRRYYRSQVFISKLVTVILGVVMMEIVSNAVTFLLRLLVLPKVDLSVTMPGGQTLLTYYGQNLGAALLNIFMLMSVVILMAMMFKSSAAAIVTGIVGYFVASIAGELMMMLIAHYEWTKWTPLTMLLLPQQVQTPQFAKMTLLSTPVMIYCTLGYTVLFTVLAYLAFRRRSV